MLRIVWKMERSAGPSVEVGAEMLKLVQKEEWKCGG
jgi:hypothetical protein